MSEVTLYPFEWKSSPTTSERRGDNLKRVGDFCREAKARIWPRLSYVCRFAPQRSHHDRICIEFMTSDRKLKASREGSK